MLPGNNSFVRCLDRLPIDEFKDYIQQQINKKSVVIIRGDTGCGKSTRVPLFIKDLHDKHKLVHDHPDRNRLKILITQPRRVACKALAKRIAEAVGETPVGGGGEKDREKKQKLVGYQIAGDSRPGRRSRWSFKFT